MTHLYCGIEAPPPPVDPLSPLATFDTVPATLLTMLDAVVLLSDEPEVPYMEERALYNPSPAYTGMTFIAITHALNTIPVVILSLFFIIL